MTIELDLYAIIRKQPCYKEESSILNTWRELASRVFVTFKSATCANQDLREVKQTPGVF